MNGAEPLDAVVTGAGFAGLSKAYRPREQGFSAIHEGE
jgi:monoamine oxidase